MAKFYIAKVSVQQYSTDVKKLKLHAALISCLISGAELD